MFDISDGFEIGSTGFGHQLNIYRVKWRKNSRWYQVFLIGRLRRYYVTIDIWEQRIRIKYIINILEYKSIEPLDIQECMPRAWVKLDSLYIYIGFVAVWE